MLGNKNQAVPADAFAVSPIPFPALKGFYISLKRIGLHVIDGLADPDLLIAWQAGELSGHLVGEANGPWLRHRLRALVES